MNIQEYWKEVRRVEAEIPEEFPWMIRKTEFNRSAIGGTLMSQVDRETAAKLLIAGDFRFASPEEILAHESRAAIGHWDANTERMRAQGIAVHVIPQATPESK